jgi:hypothetical protein
VTRRGRPRTDRLALLERVVRLLLDDPTLSANEMQVIVGARRGDVLRVVKSARALLEANPCPAPQSGPASPQGRFPFSERGGCE